MIQFNKCSFGILIPALILLLSLACRESQPAHMTTKGYELSLKYCSSCHLYTDVMLLDKTSWMNVLPKMLEEIESAGINLKENEWPEIYSHYINNAPFNITIPSTQHEQKEYINKSKVFYKNDSILASNITLLKCLDSNNLNLVIGSEDGNLFFLENELEQTSKKVNTIPVDIHYNTSDSSYTVLSMGTIGPQNTKNGMVQIIKDNEIRTIIDSLARPVHFLIEDLDDDMEEEYVISSFGSTSDTMHTGGLSIYKTIGKDVTENSLAAYTGATKSIIYDLDGDGRKDIIGLFSQGDERIVFFKNKGNLTFEEKVLLRFHPLFGCLDFELFDIDYDV